MPYKDLEKRREYEREVRAWRKEHHMCVRCGHEKADPGYTTCLVCRMDRRVSATGTRYGDKIAAQAKEIRARKKAEHICYTCSKPAYKDHAYCYEHWLSQRRAQRKWAAENRPNKNYPSNQCRICGEPVVKKQNDMGYSKFCATHYAQYVQKMSIANKERLKKKNEEKNNSN